MTLATVKVGESAERLIASIDRVIGEHTRQSPMSLDEIAGVLGFMAGGVIGHVKDRYTRRKMKEMVVANVDMGLDASMKMNGRKTSLILPEDFHQ
jgi:hypothetical protein